MQTVTLTPKTRKGRNVISRDGSLFTFIKQADRVQFDPRPGPWLLFQPVNRPQNGRWVHQTDDTDFTITEA